MQNWQNNKILLFVVLFAYAALDGWRDAWINDGWWTRHAIKWLAYYPLPIYVLWTQGYFNLQKQNLKTLAWIAGGGLFFWELTYRIFS